LTGENRLDQNVCSPLLAPTVADGGAVFEVGLGPVCYWPCHPDTIPHVHLHGAEPSLVMLRQAARGMAGYGPAGRSGDSPSMTTSCATLRS
jgi:hypothetical protein